MWSVSEQVGVAAYLVVLIVEGRTKNKRHSIGDTVVFGVLDRVLGCLQRPQGLQAIRTQVLLLASVRRGAGGGSSASLAAPWVFGAACLGSDGEPWTGVGTAT